MSLKTMTLVMAVFGILVLSAIAGEDIYNVSKETGMSPGVASTSGVRTVAPSGSSVSYVANVAGGWTLNLNDAETSRSLRLTLYQNNDAVFGSGEIAVSGRTIDVGAGGTLKGSSLLLYVVPSGEPSLYKMDLIAGPGSLSGSYVFSKQSTTQMTGTVTGVLIEASAAIPVTKNEVVTIQVGAGQTNTEKPQGPKGSAG